MVYLNRWAFCLTRKITKKKKKNNTITRNCRSSVKTCAVDRRHVIVNARERSLEQVSTFAKLYIGTVGFIFILLFMCDCLSCKNNPHMFHFKPFALFWYRNTSSGARRTTMAGGGTLESRTQRLSAHYGKRSTLISLRRTSWLRRRAFLGKKGWKVGGGVLGLWNILPPTLAKY